jgi:predicted dehydrogenase
VSALRIAIVGCGKIADQHLWAIGRIPFAKVVGVCDREPLMAEQLSERHLIDQFSDDLGRLLKDVRPDVVHITTPPQSHFALASQCLESGCHVYVEKPFTVTTDEAARLIAVADERRRKLTVGHNAQFTWENVQARELVKAGFLGGPPVYMESYYTYNMGDARYAKALLGDRDHWVRRLPGKLLQNIISHGIARIAEFMPSNAPHVAAFGYASPLLASIGESDVVDELRAYISDGGNTTATFVFSSQLTPPVNGIRLYGTKNSLEVDNVHHTVIQHEHKGYKSYANYFIPPVQAAREYLRAARRNVSRFLRSEFHDDAGLKTLVEAFYRSVLDQVPLPIGYDEILRTSRIMEAIFAQLVTAGTRYPTTSETAFRSDAQVAPVGSSTSVSRTR